jgi:hypothetical protein
VAGFVTAIIFGATRASAMNSYNTQVSTITNNFPNAKAANGACVNPKPSLTSACSALSSDGNDVNTDSTMTTVGIVAGSVGAAFAIGWYLFAPKQAEYPNKTAWTHVEPLVGPRVGGLSLGGTF